MTVEAQKREESILDVPAAVSAIGAERSNKPASAIINASGLYGGAANVFQQIKPRASQRYFGVRLKGSF